MLSGHLLQKALVGRLQLRQPPGAPLDLADPRARHAQGRARLGLGHAQREPDAPELPSAALGRAVPWVQQRAVGLARDVALQAPLYLALALALRRPPLDVGPGPGVVPHPAGRDASEGVVGLPVPSLVEPVPAHLAAGGLDGGRPAQGGECRLAPHLLGVVAGRDGEYGRGEAPRARHGQQGRGVVRDEDGDVAPEVCRLVRARAPLCLAIE